MSYEPDMIITIIARIREKANRFIDAELKRHNIKGLKPVHGDVLYALFLHKQLTMKQIAECVDRKKSTVTTLVEKLIALGYAEKKTDETDNRIFNISLTGKGLALKEDLIEISDNLLKNVYKDMPEGERAQLVKSLNVINDNW